MDNICWFTNLDIAKRHRVLDLTMRCAPEQCPTLDNYPAINVNRTVSITCDDDGVMCVPITFMCKYNPDQLEIIATPTSAMALVAPHTKATPTTAAPKRASQATVGYLKAKVVLNLLR